MGILSENAPGNPGNYEVRGSRLMNNYVGIEVQSFADAGGHPGTIENSEIGAPSLIDPYLGEIGFCGLRATGIVHGITVGRTSSSYGAGGSFNYIHDLEFGLIFNNCLAFVQNNWIENIRTFNPSSTLIKGVGIAATGTGSGFPKLLHVGFPDMGVTGINNRIEDCEKGVLAYNITAAIVDNNEIIGSGGSNPTMNIGVWFQEVGNSSEITNNTIEEFDSIGIYVRSFVGGILIEDNALDNPTIVTNATCRIAGIEVRMGINDNVDILSNTIDNVQFGIAIISSQTSAVGNTINHRLPAGCGGNFSIGILAENAPNLTLLDNSINSNCPSCSNSNIRAIDITESAQFLVDGNTMEESGVGAAAHGDCQGGNFTCNQMFDCDYGFALVGMEDGGLDIGPIAEIQSLLNASGNYWNPAMTSNRTVAVTNTAGDPTYGTPIPPATFPPIIDWRYSSFSPFFDMAPIATYNLQIAPFGGSSSRRVEPQAPASSAIPCGLIPLLGEVRNADSPSSKARNNLFSPFAFIFDEPSVAGCDFFEEKEYLYRFFADNPTWLTLGVARDAFYEDAINALSLGNYDEWYRFFDFLHISEVDSAKQTLSDLTPNCYREQLRKDVYTMFLYRQIDSLNLESVLSGSQPFSNGDLAILNSIADGKPNTDGDAVYIARAIVGRNSLVSIDFEESPRLAAQELSSNHPFVLFPNPVENEVCVLARHQTILEEYSFRVSDINGVRYSMGSMSDSGLLCLDVSMLVNGIYILEIISNSGEQHSMKFSKN